MEIHPSGRLDPVNGGTAEQSSSIAATLGLVASILGFIILLFALACLWLVSVVAARIATGVQQALASPEFQEQMVVFMVLYVIAAALVIAWNHFESLFNAPDAVVQAAATASSLFDYSSSTTVGTVSML